MEWNEKLLYIQPEYLKNEDYLYGLPSIPMAHEYETYFQNHDEVQPVIYNTLESESWIIFMYHNIDRPGNWGWYERSEFIKDVDLLHELDFWYVNMDDAVCYIQEKNNLSIDYELVESDSNLLTYKVVFADNLDNDIYAHPISVQLTLNTDRVIESVEFEDDSNIFLLQINGVRVDVEICPDEAEHEFKFNLK